MDFITSFLTTSRHHDFIMVVVDKWSKKKKIIHVESTHKVDDIARIFMREILKLHGLPKEIVSNGDTKFTSNFLKSIFKDLGTYINFSTTCYPHIDGKFGKVNQVIKDMLYIYKMHKPPNWENYLHLVYFAYNNGHQASLKMSSFEPLYEKKCRNPMSWDNIINVSVLGIEMLKQMEQEVAKIR